MKEDFSGISKLPGIPGADYYDNLILVWTTYWNDVLKPAEPLSPNIVKALLGSESSFGKNSKAIRIRAGNFARGPFQISDETRKTLANEKGEVKDHYLTLSAKDVSDPIISAAACVRWLFHKRDLASGFLKRNASWTEAVADYKGYLRRKKPFLEQKGMDVYLKFLSMLEDKG